MGMAGIKQLPCPSKIASFSGNLNREALLKVSFKNMDQFQICPFWKTTAFSKKALKPEIRSFFGISSGNFIGLFNGILFVFILSLVVETHV